jgi:hypothetical protein
MAGTFCNVKLHIVFSTKYRAEMAVVDAIVLATRQGTSAAAEASALEEWTAFALQAKGAARLVVGVQARSEDAKYTAAMMLDPILEPRLTAWTLTAGIERGFIPNPYTQNTELCSECNSGHPHDPLHGPRVKPPA